MGGPARVSGLLRALSCSASCPGGVDYSVAHSLDAFSARHDGFEDTLGGYVGISELLFLAVVIALFPFVPGTRRALAQRAAVAAAASVAAALVVAHFVSVAVD